MLKCTGRERALTYIILLALFSSNVYQLSKSKFQALSQLWKNNFLKALFYPFTPVNLSMMLFQSFQSVILSLPSFKNSFMYLGISKQSTKYLDVCLSVYWCDFKGSFIFLYLRMGFVSFSAILKNHVQHRITNNFPQILK